MSFLLIILLLAFVYCLIPGRVPEPLRTRLIIGLCVCAAGVIGWHYFFAKREGENVISAKYPRAVAYMLGQQVRKDIKKGGGVAVILNERAKWTSDRQIEGLKQALEGSGLKMLEPIYETFSEDAAALAPGRLEDIAAKTPGAVAIITFMDVPELREEDKVAGLPPVYVFQAGDPEVCRAWLEAGLVWGACFYKDEVNWETAPARMSGLESAFRDRFKLATPGDLPPSNAATK